MLGHFTERHFIERNLKNRILHRKDIYERSPTYKISFLSLTFRFYEIRLLGRFATICAINFEHVLFADIIVYKKTRHNICGFY